MAKNGKGFRVGMRVRTNDAYSRLISETPREGTLEKPIAWTDGLWRVTVDGISEPWLLHANFLERAE